MKKSLFCVIILSLILLSNCKKDEQPLENRDLFTLTFPSYINTSASDNWIIASDQQGNIIAYVPYEVDNQLSLTLIGATRFGLDKVTIVDLILSSNLSRCVNSILSTN